MRTQVTAILVARAGGEWLESTLQAIAAQTRRPDQLISVVNGANEAVAAQLAAGGVDRVVSVSGYVPFGHAVQAGVTVAQAPSGAAGVADAADVTGAAGVASAPGEPARYSSAQPTHEWFWLLAEDSAPEPEALAQILKAVQKAPSVVIAGPKLVDWNDPERIIELGQSLTRFGSRWLLRRQELDQQQYDHLEDVLGVGPVGMLVRADVWRSLGGFEPGLPVFDDGLDLSVRARLAGYRVVVAPGSRVRFAQSGVAGPRVDRARSVMRTAHRQGRAAHLFRRIAYAPAIAAFFMWLGLPVLGVMRMFWSLIREQPGQILGELGAALQVFFRPGRIFTARRRIRKQSTAGWSAVRPLRTDPKTVRTARMIERESILAAQGRLPREMHFISTGGLGVLLTAAVAAIALTWWAITQTSLTGGALAPLSDMRDLWINTRSVDGVPADPFAWVLAILGSLTFWNPSHAIVLFLVAAIPLAAMGGWIWAAQLTESASGRVVVGLGWALSPVLLGSLASGRLSTLILAVVLPWLLLAATRCRESWSWAGTASLLAAVALACAPILIPAAIVLLVVGVFSSVRGIARVLSVAIAPLALFVPKIIAAVTSGRPLDLLLDPGVTPAYEPGTPWHLLLGFPEFGLQGWASIFESLGFTNAPATLLVGVLFLPLALLALVGLFTGRVAITILHAVLGGLGLLTGVFAAQLHLLPQGSQSLPLWTGSGLALYWVAMLGLAAVGATTLRRVAAPIVAVGLVGALLAVSPLAVKLVTGSTDMKPGSTQMPAIVQAAGALQPGLGTLVLTVESSDAVSSSVSAELITGPGLRLDDVRTAERVPGVTERDQWIAALVGQLASSSGASGADAEALGAELEARNIGFVLLSAETNFEQGRARLQAALQEQPSLETAGNTAHGLLWRVAGDIEAGELVPNDRGWLAGTTISGHTVWIGQLVLLFAMLLLALPTGEVVERPARRKRPGAMRSRGKVAAGAVAGTDASASEATAEAEAEAAEVDGIDGGPGGAEAEPVGANSEPPIALEPASDPGAPIGTASPDAPDPESPTESPTEPAPEATSEPTPEGGER